MIFTFGQRSESELRGVHPDLVAVVRRALELTAVDFAVHDGLRTDAEQAEYVRTGVSKTMNSKHLLQHDGYGHAVDLVPYVNGKLRWEWPLIYPVISAVQLAARERSVSLTWGGVWDRALAALSDDLEAERDAYADRRRALGKKAFLDGPHLELRG